MDLPPFWAHADVDDIRVWRWSHHSLQDASRQAEEAARKLADRVRTQGFPRGQSQADTYGYGSQPLREPVLERIQSSDGALIGAVTRNAYGSRVLNTHRVMFVDIDIGESVTRWRRWDRMRCRLGFPRRPDPKTYEREGPWLVRIEAWTQKHPEWGWRVYRTCAGLRLLATHQVYAPDDPLVEAAFEATGADPLYRDLCRRQKSFRARLTPKPWRIGMGRPTERWPYPNSASEVRFERWEASYRKRIRNWATCQWIARFGNDVIHPDVARILPVHDDPSKATVDLPLA